MQLPFHEGANPKVFENARFLKKGMTPAEKLLWSQLRGRKLNGIKFRRQHPVSSYILDYYCHEAKLVVEVDGEIHNTKENQSYDRQRTADLEALGLKVIRFKNDEILNHLSDVLTKISIITLPFSSQEKGQG